VNDDMALSDDKKKCYPVPKNCHNGDWVLDGRTVDSEDDDEDYFTCTECEAGFL